MPVEMENLDEMLESQDVRRECGGDGDAGFGWLWFSVVVGFWGATLRT